jgi:protein tyrosine/serine phosphatase
MSYYLKKVKIKSILNLRGETDNDWYKNELFISKEYNITHYDYGISDRRIVTIKQINDILNIIKKAPKPILIHCKAGADRTSLVTAVYVYSISHNYKKAKQQLSFFYGHFPYFGSKTIAMDKSFENFIKSNQKIKKEKNVK